MNSLSSSQESDLNEEEMEEMERSAIPVSTSRATKHCIKKFNEWCRKRNVDVYYHTITAVELSTI